MQEQSYTGTEKTAIICCDTNIKFTIFFFGQPESCETHGEEIVCIPKMGAFKLISSPSKFYRNLGTIKIGKEKYLCPAPIEDYLAFTYFNSWKDKTDRRHGDTYNLMHAKQMQDFTNKNEAVIWK